MEKLNRRLLIPPSIKAILNKAFFYFDPQPVSSYPVYHSVHDTFHWMKTFVDPDFLYHRAVAQIWLQFAVLLSDSVILPFNCTRYAQRLLEYAGDIVKNHGETLRKNNITLGLLSTKFFLASSPGSSVFFLRSSNSNSIWKFKRIAVIGSSCCSSPAWIVCSRAKLDELKIQRQLRMCVLL